MRSHGRFSNQSNLTTTSFLKDQFDYIYTTIPADSTKPVFQTFTYIEAFILYITQQCSKLQGLPKIQEASKLTTRWHVVAHLCCLVAMLIGQVRTVSHVPIHFIGIASPFSGFINFLLLLKGQANYLTSMHVFIEVYHINFLGHDKYLSVARTCWQRIQLSLSPEKCRQ